MFLKDLKVILMLISALLSGTWITGRILHMLISRVILKNAWTWEQSSYQLRWKMEFTLSIKSP